ncbi:hypothetical protein BT96DRAFT_1092705 [Gymnopus androsaceus JB14]|uniref:Uncharacterized protein n=1 Tax=Gymnopus androsaceus JB14 TaxID=1447944 RepID=A0A6A4GI45_9AGAR|nr:hypothetical protein BT96DRAFT_1092705 [Gymnopus androsaceus JB14]
MGSCARNLVNTMRLQIRHSDGLSFCQQNPLSPPYVFPTFAIDRIKAEGAKAWAYNCPSLRIAPQVDSEWITFRQTVKSGTWSMLQRTGTVKTTVC